MTDKYDMVYAIGVGSNKDKEGIEGMRTSDNQYRNGQLLNGFDYDLQVWVRSGVILDCGHPAEMSKNDYSCCNAKKYKGEKITTVRAQLSIS